MAAGENLNNKSFGLFVFSSLLLCPKLFFQFEADASAMLPMKLPTRTLFIASVNNDQTTRQQVHLQVQIVSKSKKMFENRKDHITSLCTFIPSGNTLNKNCLGSFQVLWNKNCTTNNEKKIMKILIKNLYQKNNQKRGKN